MCGPLPTYPANVDAIGAVLLEVLVDEQGEVIAAKPLSGHPLFVPGAVEAASKTRFYPVLLGGDSVKFRGLLRYEFSPGEVRLTNAAGRERESAT
jgi:protein TonB